MMKPTNNFVNPLLTDLYQLTMAYAYWKNSRADDKAVFDLFFRKNPFGGEFTIFAGLEEVVRFVENFHFSDKQIAYLREVMPHCKPAFFRWLKNLDCSQVKLYAISEGTIVFPKVPLIRVEGPLATAQLLETTLLNLVNYASLMTTNAARFRLAAGWDKSLLEFGLRRAQGPDGGISASRYSYLGSFDGTSNILAGQVFGIPVKGTHAHSFVESYLELKDLASGSIDCPNGKKYDFVKMVLDIREELEFTNTNEGELAAFIAYAQSFPSGFLALVDTYDTSQSGVPNYICVAIALKRIGYNPVGIRLDSGDLAYESKRARKMFKRASQRTDSDISASVIVASNDIDEEILYSLKEQGHEINSFGIGTWLVTCKAQPALGCVYKLVEINRKPRIKLSNDPVKMTIPGRKEAYRLIGEDEQPLLDLMIWVGEKIPRVGEKVMCRDSTAETKRVLVTPSKVIPLHKLIWDGQRLYPEVPIIQVREYVIKQLKHMREDYLRPVNPTPYKISVSEELYEYMHRLLLSESPVAELK